METKPKEFYFKNQFLFVLKPNNGSAEETEQEMFVDSMNFQIVVFHNLCTLLELHFLEKVEN